MLRTLTILLAGALGTTALAKELPPIDAFLDSPAEGQLPSSLPKRLLRGEVAHVDEHLGVPTFYWAAREEGPSLRALGLSPEQAARRHVFALAPLYRQDAERLSSATLHRVHDTGDGAVLVTFRKELFGLPVFRDELRVVMDRELRLVAVTGYLTPHQDGGRLGRPSFLLDATTALAVAFQDLTGKALEPSALQPVGVPAGGWLRYAPTGPHAPAFVGKPRARRVLFALPEGLLPAYHLELDVGSPERTSGDDYYAYVISARDGQVLFRKDLVANDKYSYRVWADPQGLGLPLDGPQGGGGTPHPTGTLSQYQPPFVLQSLVTLEHGPISTRDAWLPQGATESLGNNVDAYADLASPDGYSSGDQRATTTAALTFDRTFDPTQQPNANNTQIQAAVTQLFYDNNFLHDWYYDKGFDEASGNAQASNLGRGGLDGDRLLAEAQDYSGRSNANMAAPADGASPRMQMYVFDGNAVERVTVTAPANLAGNYAAGVASFGPQTFLLSGALALVSDGVAPADDACSALQNAAQVAGRIAVVMRGNCNFNVKVKAAQDAGAVGAILVNNAAGGPPALSGTDPTIQIPALSLSQPDGNALIAELQAGGAVSVTLQRDPLVDRDGTLDNAIVSHEWGHYISNRLIGDANGLNNNQGFGLGEGWGDFHSMLVVVRPEDALVAANANWSGVYGLAGYVSGGGGNDGFYFGIRRVPYSTDFAKNALTLKHIGNGAALPAGVPTAFGASGSSNAESHNTGEVWATMLWECYAALLRSGRLTFAQAQDRMVGYLVAAYKATPNSPTLLEARDALLAVAAAKDLDDFKLFHQAFARRGAGMGAAGPVKSSRTNTPVTESFLTGNELRFLEAKLDDSITSCDQDGQLDNDETGKLTVTLKNVGTGPLTATVGKVSTTSPGVTFGAGGALTFSSSLPFGTATASLPVSLKGPNTLQVLELSLELNDPALQTPGPRTVSVRVRANLDVVPTASVNDDVEAPTTAWTTGSDASLGKSAAWAIREVSPTDHLWSIPDNDAPSDQWLVSPRLEVAPSGTFGFSFRHRWDFEARRSRYYDGGVIELSTDDGKTWTDIGNFANPGYNATLDATAQSANPLRGRAAYGGKSTGYPALVSTTVNLGTAYRGKAVRVRFRVGTDDAAGAGGWEVDDLSFTGLANAPFPALTADAGCTNRAPVAKAGADLAVDEGARGQLDGTASFDPDAEALTFQWAQASGPKVALEGADTPTPAFTAPDVVEDSLLVFQLVVRDGAVASLPSTVRVTVRQVNQRPRANAGEALTVREGEQVTLGGSAVDPDGDPVVLAWGQTSGAAVALSDPSSATPSFTAPEVNGDETLTFALVASDPLGQGAPSFVAVTVVDRNRAPTVRTGDSLYVLAGSEVALAGQASDDDGDALTLQWRQVDGPEVTLSDASAERPTFTAPSVDAVTTLRFELTASDGQAQSAPAALQVTVAPARSGCGCTSGVGLSAPLAGLLLLALRRRRPRAR